MRNDPELDKNKKKSDINGADIQIVHGVRVFMPANEKKAVRTKNQYEVGDTQRGQFP